MMRDCVSLTAFSDASAGRPATDDSCAMASPSATKVAPAMSGRAAEISSGGRSCGSFSSGFFHYAYGSAGTLYGLAAAANHSATILAALRQYMATHGLHEIFTIRARAKIDHLV